MLSDFEHKDEKAYFEVMKEGKTLKLVAQAASFCVGVLMTFSLAAQSEIIMDGVFDDWANIPGVVDGDDPGVMDLLEMKVANDETYLYVYLRVAEEIKLVEALIPHSIYLQIDTDVDAATGYEVQEGFGSELELISRITSPTSMSSPMLL